MSGHHIENVGQLAIAVSDLKPAVEFYRDILGLRLLFEAPPGLAFFDCGGTRMMVTTPQGDEADHHTSVIYYRVSDLPASVEDLRNRGVSFERGAELVARMDDHELWMAFLRDPDRNLIGLMSEVPLE